MFRFSAFILQAPNTLEPKLGEYSIRTMFSSFIVIVILVIHRSGCKDRMRIRRSRLSNNGLEKLKKTQSRALPLKERYIKASGSP